MYGLKIKQQWDMNVTVSSPKSFDDVSECSIDRCRGKEPGAKLNSSVISQFRSLNIKICWIGLVSYSFCAFASSFLLQKLLSATVSILVQENVRIRRVNDLRNGTKHYRPSGKWTFSLTILSFADASRTEDKGQIGILSELPIWTPSLKLCVTFAHIVFSACQTPC